MRARDLPKLEKALDPKQNMLAGSMKLYARIRNYARANTVYNCSTLEVLGVNVDDRKIKCKVADGRTIWFDSRIVNLDYEATEEDIRYNGRSWEEHLAYKKRQEELRVPEVRDRFDKLVRVGSPIVFVRYGIMEHDVVLGLKEGKPGWYTFELKRTGRITYSDREIRQRMIVFPKDHRKGLGVW